jgi:hypothetical protein
LGGCYEWSGGNAREAHGEAVIKVEIREIILYERDVERERERWSWLLCWLDILCYCVCCAAVLDGEKKRGKNGSFIYA